MWLRCTGYVYMFALQFTSSNHAALLDHTGTLKSGEIFLQPSDPSVCDGGVLSGQVLVCFPPNIFVSGLLTSSLTQVTRHPCKVVHPQLIHLFQ